MTTTSNFDGIVRLPHWAVIQVSGADAAQFLHQQFSQDIVNQPSQEARLAAYCNAKGRMLASLMVVRTGAQEFHLLLSADLAAPTLKRLQMYVLRSKVALRDASAEQPVFGWLGTRALAVVGADTEPAVWSVHTRDGMWHVVLPLGRDALSAESVAVPRVISFGAPAGAQAATPIDLVTWEALEVMSGVPRLEAVNVEQFIPQMVNFELVSGVNFKKGCYPGQEIVARSHYLGALKRRMFLFSSGGTVRAGQDVFHASDPQQPCGRVVNAAPALDGVHHVALVELKLSVWDLVREPQAGGQPLHTGSLEGPTLNPHSLPYAVLAQDAPERQLLP